jgi:transposase
MNDNIILSNLVPPDFIFADVCSDTERIELILQSKSRKGACPDCGTFSASIHSRYVRTLADLPASGRSVLFRIDVRRFRCRLGGRPSHHFYAGVYTFGDQSSGGASAFGKRPRPMECLDRAA